MPTARGSFEITRTMHPPIDAGDGATFGAFRFEKQFTGGLVATSVVEMLSVGSPPSGSAAYVAVERIAGAVDGRAGSFCVHHTGVIDQGAQSLSIRVVNGTGTGDLSGIRGSMTIQIVEGKHCYELEWEG